MDQEVEAQTWEAWRPVVWLIGIILLVHGINEAIKYNPFGIRQIARFFPHAIGYGLANIASIAVHFIIAVGLIVAGIGLWRRAPWARRTAVGLLECSIVFTILLALVMPLLRGQGWQVDQTSYWLSMLRSLQPSSLVANLIMLLALLIPVEQQVLGEEPPPGIFTGVAKGIRRRLPAGTPPLWLLIGLLFFCWGAGPWLNYVLTPLGIMVVTYLRGYEVPNLFSAAIYYVLPDMFSAAIYLVAGIWLLANRRRSRQAAIFAVLAGIACQLFMSIYFLMLGFQHAVRPLDRSLVEIVLYSPIGIALQLAVPIAILLILRQAPPPAEGVGKAVPER